MPRPLSWGTPGRSTHYLKPRRAYVLFLLTLLVGVGLTFLLMSAQLVGWRSPLSPGKVSAKHASYDARCQECHAGGQGVPNVRCQRCHDPSVGGRMDHAAHVLFGSLDEQKAAAAPQLECAVCHVEHRGAVLSAVPQGACVGCHDDAKQVATRISRFSAHPEFAVLKAGRQQAAGIIYSHLTHVTKGKGKKAGYMLIDADRRAQGIDTPAKTCLECHQRKAQDDEFAAISFEAHCLSCHRGELKMEPAALASLVPFDQVPGMAEAGNVRAEDFESQNGQIQKIRVQHRDEWVLFNLRRLQRELDPDGFASERAALGARRTSLERRLILAEPPAVDDARGLKERIAAVREELSYIDARLLAQTQAQAPTSAARLDEVASAAAASGDAQAQAKSAELLRRLAALSGSSVPGSLSVEEFAARKAEVLRLLDAVEKADPARKAQLDELRRRLEALKAGQSSSELLRRARVQRQATLERLQDEVLLRETGTAAPPEALLRDEVQELRRSLRDVDAQLALLDAVEAPAGPLTVEERQARLEAVANLSKGCGYCHQISATGSITPVKAAEPVLRRATFQHRVHLTRGETCASCHAGKTAGRDWSIETSGASEELNFKGVASCRECHRSGGARDTCLECHRYHPKGRS